MDSILSLPFGKRIRQLRVERQLSLRDLADRVGIDFTYLSKIENNRSAPPSDEVIRRLARELEADPEDLLALAAKVSQEDLRRTVADDHRLGVLFRRLQSGDLTEDQIKKILQITDAAREDDAADH